MKVNQVIKLKITNIEKYIYNLVDEKGKNYFFNMEFIDVENTPKIGNYIFISDKLLNSKYDGYSTNYTFGDLDNKYGKENISMDDIDIIKIVTEEKEIYLKRLYG